MLNALPSALSRARAFVALLVLVAFSPSLSCADTLTWTGAGNGQVFNQATNWNPVKSPTASDDCIISAGAGTILIEGNTTVRTLTTARPISISNCWELAIVSALELQNGTTISLESPCATTALSFGFGSASITGSGTIAIKGAGQNGPVIAVRNGASLDIASGITVSFGPQSTGTGAHIRVDAGSTLTNSGVLWARQAAQTLAILGPGTLINNGTLKVTAGTLQLATGSWTNSATIDASSAFLEFAGAWNNTGTIAINNATWTIAGSYADFGTVQRVGGNVIVQNLSSSGVVVANASTGDLRLTSGPFTGALLQSSGGARLVASSISLAGCTLAGRLDCSGTTSISNGLTLQSGAILGTGWVSIPSGTQTIAGTGELILSELHIGSQAHLITESGIVIKGGSPNLLDIEFGSGSTLTNRGSILTNGSASFTISGGGKLVNKNLIDCTTSTSTTVTVQNVENDGEVRSQGSFLIGDFVTWLNSSTMTLMGSATISGQFTNNGLVVASGTATTLKKNWINAGIIRLTNTAAKFDGVYSALGTIERSGGSLTLAGVYTGTVLEPTPESGAIALGTVRLTNCELRTPGASIATTENATLENCTLRGELSVLGCGTITVADRLTFADNATIVVDRGPASCAPFAIEFGSGIKELLGTGQIQVLKEGNFMRLYAGANVTIAPAVSIRVPAAFAVPAATIQVDAAAQLTNQGTISIEKPGADLVITGGPFKNQGSLFATAGTLELANLSGSLGSLSVASGAFAKINGSSYTIDVPPSLSSGARLQLTGIYTIETSLNGTGVTLSIAGTWSSSGSVNLIDSVLSLNRGLSELGAYTFTNTSVAYIGTISNQMLLADATTGDVTIAGANLLSCTLLARDGKRFLTGAGHNIVLSSSTIDGELAVVGCGTISVSGTLTFANNSVLRLNNACPQGIVSTGATISGSGEIVADGASAAAAQIFAVSGIVTTSTGITLRIPASASGGGTTRIFFSSSSGRWTNEGAIINQAPGRELLFTGSGRFASSGLVEANGGAIRITSSFIENFSGNRITGGTWRSLNALLDFGNRVINQIGAGTEIELAGAAATTLHFQKLDTNSGTLRIRNKSLAIGPASTFSNSGLLDLASDATLAVTGRMVFASASTVRTQIAGLNSDQIGRITATTGCTLNGKLQGSFSNLYVPLSGDETAPFITAPSFSGAFTSTCFDANPFGLGVLPQIDTGPAPDELSLVVTEASGTLPVLTLAPIDASASPNAMFQAAAAPANATYQWKKDNAVLANGPTGSGSTISGATSPTLTILNAQPSDVGAYTVTLTNSCGTLTSNPAALRLCTGDLNADGMVDDADFVRFLSSYNILDCADPAMPALCPGDFNADGVVDDTDFQLFIPAYDTLLCP